MKKRFAFTLAEVLVTLGIIGVVSAMTIPSLTQSWQKQAYVAQLKKAYSQLSQATQYAINSAHATSLAETKYNRNVANASSNFLKDNFKVVQDCGTSYTPCFASTYKYLDGTSNNVTRNGTPEAVITTADGMAFAIIYNGIEIVSDDWHQEMQVVLDINGQKGPNVYGRDFFHTEIYDDGLVIETYDSDYRKDRDYKSDCKRSVGYGGIGCLNAIINDGWVMDY